MVDNTTYQHSPDIGSLASISKKQLVEMMYKHSVEYIDLHLTNEQRNELCDLEDCNDYPDIQDRDNCTRIGFKVEE